MVLFKKLCSRRAFIFGLFRGEERKVRTASIGPNAEMARKGTTKEVVVLGDLHLAKHWTIGKDLDQMTI